MSKVYTISDQNKFPMAIYRGSVIENTTDGNTLTTEVSQTELPIYGASRLGVYYKQADKYVYQLTDHLGNVRAVISKNATNNLAIEGATDYYPGGMTMPNRHNVDAENYRYAYQGQEKDPETGKEAFELRLWDSRIGRWLTTDPKGQYHSPYLGMGNDPINGIDADGGWKTWFGWLGGWIANGFKGGYFHNADANDPNHRYGLTLSYTTEGSGNNIGEVGFYQAFDGADIAFFNSGFAEPVLPPATTLELFTGRTIDVGNQLTLTHTIDKYGYLGGVKPVGGSGVMGLVGPGGAFKAASAYRSAVTLLKGGLVPAGKAIAKHPNILRLVTTEVVTTNAQRNHFGAQAIKYIMRNGAKSTKVGKEYGKAVKYIDYKLPSGLGVRFYEKTNTLKGFLGRGL